MNEAETATALFRELESRLRDFVRRRLPQASDVEDVLQDVLLRIHRSLESLTDETRAPAWIFRIATNAIADHYRDQARRAVVSSEIEAPADEPDPAAAARKDLARCLEPFLDRVAEPYREAVRLVDLEGRTHIEAARRLGLSVSGMKSRVQRGREKLREALTHCCRVEFDRRGHVVDFAPRSDPGTGCCSGGSCSTAETTTNKETQR